MLPHVPSLIAIILAASLAACERKAASSAAPPIRTAADTISQGYKQLPTTPTATTPLTSPPQITASMEDGFVDPCFYLSAHSTEPDGSQTFIAKGLDGNLPVAFIVKLEPGWKGSELVKGIDVYSGIVHVLSAGPESDQLLKSLDRLYATNLKPAAMTTDAKLAGIALEGNPKSPQSGLMRIKLFRESEKKDEYAEFFVNIDLANKRIDLREKDEVYRKAVVKALTAP